MKANQISYRFDDDRQTLVELERRHNGWKIRVTWDRNDTDAKFDYTWRAQFPNSPASQQLALIFVSRAYKLYKRWSKT